MATRTHVTFAATAYHYLRLAARTARRQHDEAFASAVEGCAATVRELDPRVKTEIRLIEDGNEKQSKRGA